MFEIGSQIEKYEILSQMGEGGMARVFKVRHTLLGSFHALKVLDPTHVQNAELRQRFLSEGQIQARLKHSNIVSVTDIIAQPGVAGLVVEYVDGPTLDSVIRDRHHRSSPAATVALFLPLLDGLDYAHRSGVVHRDIKPSNIIVDRDSNGRPVARLLDFGIAKLSDGALGGASAKGKTRTGVRMGTTHYMSPEQIRGQEVDGRTDLFSLAVTLYEYVAGVVPFDADSDFDTMSLIIQGKPRPIRELCSDVDPRLEACIERGLAPERERRFQTCREFAAALGQVTAAPQEGAAIIPGRAFQHTPRPRPEPAPKKVYAPPARVPPEPQRPPVSAPPPVDLNLIAGKLNKAVGDILQDFAGQYIADPVRLAAVGHGLEISQRLGVEPEEAFGKMIVQMYTSPDGSVPANIEELAMQHYQEFIDAHEAVLQDPGMQTAAPTSVLTASIVEPVAVDPGQFQQGVQVRFLRWPEETQYVCVGPVNRSTGMVLIRNLLTDHDFECSWEKLTVV